MKEETVKMIDELIAKYSKKEYASELFYDFFATPHNPGINMELMIGPIESSGIEGELAKKIAQKHRIKLRQYDFSRGKWSESRDYGTVFSAVIRDNESEYEKIIKELLAARKEFNKVIHKITEGLGYK